MQRKIWKWVSLIIILIAIVKFIIPSILGEAQAVTQIESKPLDTEIAEHILQTSIQITMVEHVLEKIETQDAEAGQDEVWQKVDKSTSGLGTLVNHQGEVLLISHDHWSLFTSSTAPDKVTFRDAKERELNNVPNWVDKKWCRK